MRPPHVARPRLRHLSPAAPGHEGHGLLFVKGYLTEGCDYTAWADALARLGWRGEVAVLEWFTGGRLDSHMFGALAGTTLAHRGLKWGASLLVPGLGALPAAGRFGRWALRAGQALSFGWSLSAGLDTHWSYYGHRADSEGRKLGRFLARGRPTWARRSLRLTGYSLGARLIYAALGEAAAEGGPVVDDVDLYAGAISTEHDWTKALGAVSGRVRNFYSLRDDVLGKLFPLAESSTAIGRAPIPVAEAEPGPNPRLTNHDVTEWIGSHGDYPTKLDAAASRDFRILPEPPRLVGSEDPPPPPETELPT